ncbi:hypothetical protein T265_08762 [Opisthorchis viverrini]|uniref:UBC core domain-containing protein n=1 Tax=Opisthorchis viverrini TaxID=6198 RepID=A0A074ZCL3_OPIVI|nr:hypothetical protein T265_08762 [Opisthorchis viverrini]KER23352.1 hypothetical protein T265_08762 [Opisthorchis viverrini]
MPLKRINKALQNLGCDCFSKRSSGPFVDNFFTLQATVMGIPMMLMREAFLPEDYRPFKPSPPSPKLNLNTKIHQPNTNENGSIQISQVATLSNLLLSIRQLLTNPNLDDPLLPDTALQYNSDRKTVEFAQQWTQKYAI